VTVFPGACSVTSCRFNLGGGRVSCDWLRNGRGRCHHPTYREAWSLGHDLEQALQEVEAAPILTATETARSLTSRATAANAPMSPERARQLIMSLEGA